MLRHTRARSHAAAADRRWRTLDKHMLVVELLQEHGHFDPGTTVTCDRRTFRRATTAGLTSTGRQYLQQALPRGTHLTTTCP
jgi:hypothetical protein